MNPLRSFLKEFGRLEEPNQRIVPYEDENVGRDRPLKNAGMKVLAFFSDAQAPHFSLPLSTPPCEGVELVLDTDISGATLTEIEAKATLFLAVHRVIVCICNH
jgi:hypothetical protein